MASGRLQPLGNAVRLKRLRDSTSRMEERLSSLTDLEQILIGESPGITSIRQLIRISSPAPSLAGPVQTSSHEDARAPDLSYSRI